MLHFLNRHKDEIFGVISCYDRIVFKGYIRQIQYVDGMMKYLNYKNILLKDFGAFVKSQSSILKTHAKDIAGDNGRPYQYLYSPSLSKEKIAESIATQDKIKDGLICVMGCVEPCTTFDICRNKNSKKLELISRLRQCLFVYFYYMDRKFGLMYIRLQTWFPFHIQIGINGYSYLAKQLTKSGVGFERYDNCFTKIDKIKTAQKIAYRMLEIKWPRFFDKLAKRINPLISLKVNNFHYYWVCHQSEYATDIIFKDSLYLKTIYNKLSRYAINNFDSRNVLRFLGKRYRSDYKPEVVSTYKHRPEGICVKHWVKKNSIKMYDKGYHVLRIEVTINRAKEFFVYRDVNGRGLKWMRMRKGVADFWRRAEVSRAANERYLEALSVVGNDTPSFKVLDKVDIRIKRNNNSFRAIRAISVEECNFFKAIIKGENLIHGFRNGDIQNYLYKEKSKSKKDARRRSNKVGYKLRLYRTHGLIKKVPKTRLYRITQKGHEVIATAILFRNPEINLLKICA